MCTFIDKSKFLPENTNALRGYKTFVQNPTKSELLGGNYKPRLTITNRFNSSGYSDWTLSIELSLPKLMFGNNFDELSDRDFPAIIVRLQVKLKEMGVSVFTALIENAPVSAIHFSKNISLTDGSTPHYYISKIKEASVPLALDVNETSYQNDGYGFKWHANSYEVAFYDKINDLTKAKVWGDKRAIEKENFLQMNLFKELQNRDKFEVLRMEVRLNHRQKMKKLFRTLGINQDLTFRQLFSSEISMRVLTHYINKISKQRPPIVDAKTKDKDLLADLIIENPKMRISKIFTIYGLRQALKNIDIRELRGMFGGYSKQTWAKMLTEVKNANIIKTSEPFTIIRACLVNYQPLKLVDFQDKMINNDKYN